MKLPTDVIRAIALIRTLAPATRKIRQRKLEANMGLPAGALSEECLTAPRGSASPAPAPVTKAVHKAPKKRRAKKKKTK